MTAMIQFAQALKPGQEHILQAVCTYALWCGQDPQSFMPGISDDVDVYFATQPNHVTGEASTILKIIS